MTSPTAQPCGRSRRPVRVSRHDGSILDEAGRDRKLAVASRRAELRRSAPEVRVRIGHFRDERDRLELIRILVLRQRKPRDEFDQHLAPVVIQDVAVGEPVLDDVPEAVERQKLISGIGESQPRVCELVLEHRISNARGLRDVELLAAGSIAMNGAQKPGQIAPQHGFMADPVRVRAHVQVVVPQGDARGCTPPDPPGRGPSRSRRRGRPGDRPPPAAWAARETARNPSDACRRPRVGW